jgi:hypothetical protein
LAKAGAPPLVHGFHSSSSPDRAKSATSICQGAWALEASQTGAARWAIRKQTVTPIATDSHAVFPSAILASASAPPL